MTREERRAMKAACVQTAVTLIAAWDSGKGQIDAEECVKTDHITKVELRSVGRPLALTCRTKDRERRGKSAKLRRRLMARRVRGPKRGYIHETPLFQ